MIKTALLPESIYGEILLGKQVMPKPNLCDRLFVLAHQRWPQLKDHDDIKYLNQNDSNSLIFCAYSSQGRSSALSP